MNNQGGRIFRTGFCIGERQIEHADGLRVHPARHVEAGEIDLGRGVLLSACGGRNASGLDQGVRPRVEVPFPVFSPFAEIEDRPHRRRRALGPAIGRRQRQATGLAENNLVGPHIGGDVIGVRADRHAVDRFQERQLDKILPLDEAARGRPCRHHEQRVAGIRIGEAVKKACAWSAAP